MVVFIHPQPRRLRVLAGAASALELDRRLGVCGISGQPFSLSWTGELALFLRCNTWRQAAENTAESLTRGSRVIVSGRLKQRSFETKEGERRTVIELEVEEIGPSLRYATAKVNKAARANDARPTAAGNSQDDLLLPLPMQSHFRQVLDAQKGAKVNKRSYEISTSMVAGRSRS